MKGRISSNWISSQLCLMNDDKFFFLVARFICFDINSKNVIKKYNINTYSVIKCIDNSSQFRKKINKI